MSTIDSFSDIPKYSIKTVCVQTGIRAVTLRAWERRYNILTPHRTNSNYRNYSERDIAVLRWLKLRVDAGISISAAAAELAEMRTLGNWPEAIPALEATSRAVAPNPPNQYAERLFAVLIAHDEEAASAVLAEAHSIFDLTTVCIDVITPCLIMLGDAWHRGEILISTEHIASNYLRGRITSLFQSFPARRGAPYIIMACAPSERHEIGSLMLATLLRRDGYRVEYLGTGIPTEDLVDFIVTERPALTCFAAGSEEAARELLKIHAGIMAVRPTIKFGFGGRAFVSLPQLCESTPGIFLGSNVREAHATIQQLFA